MNKQTLRVIYKLLFFTFIFFMSCGFQTSFWPNVVHFLPSPQIWLIVLMFICIKWKSFANIFFVYFLLYGLTFFSEVPLKMLWTTLGIVYFVTVTIKNRIQLTGVFSFILLSFGGSIMFEVGYYLFSDLLEPIPTNLHLLDRLTQILVNFIFSYPLYYALEILDNVVKISADWRHDTTKQTSTGHEYL